MTLSSCAAGRRVASFATAVWISRKRVTIVGQYLGHRAAGEDERHGGDLADEVGLGERPAGLIDQRKRRHRVARLEPRRRRRARRTQGNGSAAGDGHVLDPRPGVAHLQREADAVAGRQPGRLPRIRQLERHRHRRHVARDVVVRHRDLAAGPHRDDDPGHSQGAVAVLRRTPGAHPGHGSDGSSGDEDEGEPSREIVMSRVSRELNFPFFDLPQRRAGAGRRDLPSDRPLHRSQKRSNHSSSATVASSRRSSDRRSNCRWRDSRMPAASQAVSVRLTV